MFPDRQHIIPVFLCPFKIEIYFCFFSTSFFVTEFCIIQLQISFSNDYIGEFLPPFLLLSRAYEEVPWDKMLPSKIEPPESTVEVMADPVSQCFTKRRYNPEPEISQVSEQLLTNSFLVLLMKCSLYIVQVIQETYSNDFK